MPILLAEEIAITLLADEIVHHIKNDAVNSLLIARQNAAAQFINDGALLVHHIIVFERTLADGVVLLLHPALRRLDGAVEPAMLHDLTLLEAKALHKPGKTLRAEKAHELILERNEELRAAGIALTRAAASELAINTARLMTLGADDMKATKLLDTLAKLDVRSAASHVRSNRNSALHACERHNLRFASMILGVQDLMRDVGHLEHTRENLGRIHRDGTQKNGLALSITLRHISDDRLELLALRAINLVVAVNAIDRLICGDGNNIELVNILELARLRLRRTRHARELLVKAEVVLDRDRSESLRLLLNLNALLRLNSLMETIRPAAARKNTPRELIYDINVIILYNVVNILFVKAVGAEKLRHHMDAVAPLHELRLRNAAAIDALCIGQGVIAINRAHFSSEIGKNKEPRIFRANLFASPICKGDLARALVNREEKLALKLVRTLLTDIREHLHLAILVKLAEIGILKKMPKLLVLWHRVVNLINLLLRRLKIARFKSLLGSLNKIVALRSLNANNGIHKRTNLLIDVARGNRCRP